MPGKKHNAYMCTWFGILQGCRCPWGIGMMAVLSLTRSTASCKSLGDYLCTTFLGLQMLLPQTEHFFLGGTWQSYVLNKVQHIRPASGGKPYLTQWTLQTPSELLQCWERLFSGDSTTVSPRVTTGSYRFYGTSILDFCEFLCLKTNKQKKKLNKIKLRIKRFISPYASR